MREAYVELPDELGLGPEKVDRLLRSMYGCRDAGLNWELTVAKRMKAIGFTQGKSSPCLHYHATRKLRTTVHGDDFTTLGPRESRDWLHGELSKEWTISIRGILGPPDVAGCDHEIIILNRILTWGIGGI